MKEYILYGFTNTKSKDINKCLMFYDEKNIYKTYSVSYYRYNHFHNVIPFVPLDFKYMLEVTIDLNKVYVAKHKKDYITSMFSEKGKLNSEVIKEHCKKDIKGVILFEINSLRKNVYFPVVMLNDECILDVKIKFKQEPTERLWISVEECDKYNKIDCLDSQSCKVIQTSNKKHSKVCKDDNEYQRMKLQRLNRVMLPYKFYAFTEFQTSMYNSPFQISGHFKPNGFWFAQGDEWLQHMKKTNFRMTRYNYLYELELNLDEFIVITNLKDLHEFTRKFCVSNKNNPYCYILNWVDVVLVDRCLLSGG